MITFNVFEQVDCEEWNREIVRIGGTALHSYQWSLYASENINGKPLYFKWKEDNKNAGLVYGILTYKRVMTKKIFETLSFVSFPACENIEIYETMIHDLIQYAKNYGIMSLNINSFSTPLGTEVLENHRFLTKKRWEFIVDINRKEEDLFKTFNENKRRKIRKGLKENLSIRVHDDTKSILKLCELSFSVQKRKNKKGIAFGKLDENYCKRLKTFLIDSGVGKLYLAYYNNECIAGAFIGFFNNAVYYMLGFSDNIGLRKNAPDLIIWKCMNDHQKLGYKSFNLGGVSETDTETPIEKTGLYYFKKSFSAVSVSCLKGTLVLHPFENAIHLFLKKTKSLR